MTPKFIVSFGFLTSGEPRFLTAIRKGEPFLTFDQTKARRYKDEATAKRQGNRALRWMCLRSHVMRVEAVD